MTARARTRASDSVVEQIRDLIDDLAESGALADRGRLPSERVITERIGCARMTARTALWQLEAEGMVFRANRSGWYLSPPRLQYDPTRDVSFTETAIRQGRKPDSIVLSVEETRADHVVAANLGVNKGRRIVFIVRTRLLDDRPVFVERSHVLANRCPGLAKIASSEVSLARLYEREYGLTIRRQQIVMHPTALSEDDAQALRVSPGTPGLHLRRLSADQNGLLFSFDVEAWAHHALAINIRPRATGDGNA